MPADAGPLGQAVEGEEMNGPEEQDRLTRRQFLSTGLRTAAAVGLGGAAGAAALAARGGGTVWQIDPAKCIQCGNCATYCVLQPSAVKCVHSFEICGYCVRCFGFFEPQAGTFDEGAENQLCPTGAIQRNFIEEERYEYRIDEKLCIGCGKCVKGCNAFGNGAFYLQVRHDRCVHCNECSIAAACPSGAFVRLPAGSPYLLKDEAQHP